MRLSLKKDIDLCRWNYQNAAIRKLLYRKNFEELMHHVRREREHGGERKNVYI